MTEQFFVKLKNRGLLHIEGKDRYDFLQNLITNNIKNLTPTNQVYACLLSPQGKFLHDFFIREGDGFLLIDCEGGERAQDLFKRLNMYRLRADVQISVENKNDVFGILKSRHSERSEESDQKSDPSSQAPQDDNIALKDPRHPDMGFRTFIKPNLPEKPFEEWDTRRIELVIPDGSRDLIVNKSTMDEARMDTLNAIDYDKGCYVGQELTARMHYRGLGKKHLQCVDINNLPDKAELRSTCGDIGLALIRNN